MIQILIAVAILGIIYFTFLGGDSNKTKKEPAATYQQEIQKAKGLEQTVLQAADQKARDIDRQISQGE